jgi:hypothetical protein
MKELTDEQFEELKSHSIMLGIIATYVEDFCDEECTTLQGVMRLLAQYHMLKAESLWQKLESN